MFSGIIKNVGIINRIYINKKNCSLEIYSKIRFTKGNISKFYISKETLNKTIFKSSKKGDVINFEKSIRFGDRLSGHFVQGHVDTTSKVKKITRYGKSWLVDFVLAKNHMKNLVSKGSITINGVSLTIANLNKFGFQISLIPKTLASTNLIRLKKGDQVNIEFDIIGKYIKKYIK